MDITSREQNQDPSSIPFDDATSLVRFGSAEHRRRAEDFVSRLADIVAPDLAPDPLAFEGRTYAEFVNDDGEVLGWRPFDVSAIEAIGLHVDASSLREEVETPADRRVRAAGLAYDADSTANYWSIDLDGGYDAADVIAALSDAFGPNTFLVTSGSGRAGRSRLLGRPARTTTVGEIQATLTQICAGVGFAPKKGSLEIFPSTCNGRLPFGLGGCSVFDEDARFAGIRTPRALLDSFLALRPVDLLEVAARFAEPARRASVGRRRYQGDLRTRLVRARPTPEYIKRLWEHGVSGPGERDRALFLLSRDCLYSRLTYDQAVKKIEDWIRRGGLALSDDVRRNGIEWQIRKLPRLVLRVYRNVADLGVPAPLPLTQLDRANARALARRMTAGSDMPASAMERFLLRALPHYRAASLAGIPMLRMHSDVWQSFGGSWYRRLRDMSGIFSAATGYRSTRSVVERGGRPCDAYAVSWSCAFEFEAPSSVSPVETTLASVTSSAVVRGSRRVSRIIPKRLYVHREEIRRVTGDHVKKITPTPRRESNVERQGRFFPPHQFRLPRLDEHLGSLSRFTDWIYRDRAEAREEGKRKAAETNARKKALKENRTPPPVSRPFKKNRPARSTPDLTPSQAALLEKVERLGALGKLYEPETEERVDAAWLVFGGRAAWFKDKSRATGTLYLVIPAFPVSSAPDAALSAPARRATDPG